MPQLARCDIDSLPGIIQKNSEKMSKTWDSWNDNSSFSIELIGLFLPCKYFPIFRFFSEFFWIINYRRYHIVPPLATGRTWNAKIIESTLAIRVAIYNISYILLGDRVAVFKTIFKFIFRVKRKGLKG